MSSSFLAVWSRWFVRDPVGRIASPAVEQQSLTRKTVHLIFDMRWRNDDPIRFHILRDDHPVHVVSCAEIADIYPHPLRLAWNRLSFSGTGKLPLNRPASRRGVNASSVICCVRN